MMMGSYGASLGLVLAIKTQIGGSCNRDLLVKHLDWFKALLKGYVPWNPNQEALVLVGLIGLTFPLVIISNPNSLECYSLPLFMIHQSSSVFLFMKIIQQVDHLAYMIQGFVQASILVICIRFFHSNSLILGLWCSQDPWSLLHVSLAHDLFFHASWYIIAYCPHGALGILVHKSLIQNALSHPISPFMIHFKMFQTWSFEGNTLTWKMRHCSLDFKRPLCSRNAHSFK